MLLITIRVYLWRSTDVTVMVIDVTVMVMIRVYLWHSTTHREEEIAIDVVELIVCGALLKSLNPPVKESRFSRALVGPTRALLNLINKPTPYHSPTKPNKQPYYTL